MHQCWGNSEECCLCGGCGWCTTSWSATTWRSARRWRSLESCMWYTGRGCGCQPTTVCHCTAAPPVHHTVPSGKLHSSAQMRVHNRAHTRGLPAAAVYLAGHMHVIKEGARVVAGGGEVACAAETVGRRAPNSGRHRVEACLLVIKRSTRTVAGTTLDTRHVGHDHDIPVVLQRILCVDEACMRGSLSRKSRQDCRVFNGKRRPHTWPAAAGLRPQSRNSAIQTLHQRPCAVIDPPSSVTLRKSNATAGLWTTASLLCTGSGAGGSGTNRHEQAGQLQASITLNGVNAAAGLVHLLHSLALHPEVRHLDVRDGADLRLVRAVDDLHHRLRRDALPVHVRRWHPAAVVHWPLDVLLLCSPQRRSFRPCTRAPP